MLPSMISIRDNGPSEFLGDYLQFLYLFDMHYAAIDISRRQASPRTDCLKDQIPWPVFVCHIHNWYVMHACMH
jgi:hypothetical protein